MIFYIVFGVLFASLVFILLYKDKRKANKAIGLGSLLTALFIILRFGPLKLLYLMNFLLPILPFFKNFKMQNQKINATRGNEQISEDEAYEILGIPRTASKEEIKTAYNKLILKNHPDHGGSKYITEKLNQAKTILLKRR